MHRPKLPYFFLALAAVLALTALGLLGRRCELFNHPSSPKPPPTAAAPSLQLPPPAPPNPNLVEIPAAKDPAPPTPSSLPQVSHLSGQAVPPPQGLASATTEPARLVAEIAQTLATADYDTLARLLGKDVCDAKTLEFLETAADPLKIHPQTAIREVGELELNVLARWSLKLADSPCGSDCLLLDLRNTNGKWSVEKLILPPLPQQSLAASQPPDALGVADAFVQALLKQDLQHAQIFADLPTLSKAKIAALATLLAKDNYQLRPNKPLRALFNRGDTVAFVANIQTPDASQTARFALSLHLPPAPANWQICEIHLNF